MSTIVLAALAPISTKAQAAQTLTGDVIQITYSDYGNWNDTTSLYTGFQVDFEGDGTYNDYTYPGTPYQMFAVEYSIGDEAYAYYASSYYYTDITVLSETDSSTSTELISEYQYDAGALTLDRQEIWGSSDQAVLVRWEITNSSRDDVTDLRIVYAADPDQDYADYGSYTTYDDVVDADGDGTDDYVSSAGYYSDHTIGFGACEPADSELGHYGSWSSVVDADIALSDYDGDAQDIAMALRWNAPEALPSGDTTIVSMIVVVDETSAGAQTLWTDSMGLCESCDTDGDGYNNATCAGSDCDDTDATINPDATETWYDGVDSDCDGASDYDADGDGHDSSDYHGDDCDDADATVYTGATDTWYDGVDSDCDGSSDYDADGDGYNSSDYGGDDCNDADVAIYPGATDTWYDGVDSNCDGASDYDADADGHDSSDYDGDDCNDDDATIFTGATETWYDGIDSDCDGASDYDADADGQDSSDFKGEDCDDADASIYAGAEDAWYDGVDSDCDGASDYDADADGHDSSDYDGDDCNDDDAGINPDAVDIEDDGIDQDCDGTDATAASTGDGGATDGGGTDGGGTDGGGTDGGGTDSGLPGDGSTKGGCGGCASAGPSSSGMAFWGLGFLAILGLRRRS